jgi:hypothetical protein
VERLKGGGNGRPGIPTTSIASGSKTSAQGPASVADRKRQWSQLADMGIKVPEGVRSEMAMAGDWQRVARSTGTDELTEPSLSKGVRKRKLEGEEEEDEEEKTAAGELVRRNGWGSARRRYPGHDNTDIDDLLLGTIKAKKEEPATNDRDVPLRGQLTSRPEDIERPGEVDESSNHDGSRIVKEEVDVEPPPHPTTVSTEELTVPLFKKRKGKGKAS